MALGEGLWNRGGWEGDVREDGLRGIKTGRNQVFQGSDEAFEGCRESENPPSIC